MTPSRIVCAVDFSANGRAVLAQAVALAGWHEAELDVLFVRPGSRAKDAAGDDGLRAHLVEFVRQAAPAHVRTSAFVHGGEPVSSVVDHVAERPADLAIVGQDGPRRALFWSRGRFAAAVARRISIPVITVTSRTPLIAPEAQFHRIVCAVDDSCAAAKALRTALGLAQQSGGRLTVLHVIDRDRQAPIYAASSASRLLGEFDARARGIATQLRSLVPDAALDWCEVDYRVLPGVPQAVITATAAADAADLLVVGRPPQSWFGAIGSTVSAVLARATCPVLTVPGAAGVRDATPAHRNAPVDIAEFRAATLAARARRPAEEERTLWTS